MRFSLIPLATAAMLGACAPGNPIATADMNAALTVAGAAEAAYAAQRGADPATVAQLQRLLLAAQSAFAAWQTNQGSAEQAALSAAINALVVYEASAGIAKFA